MSDEVVSPTNIELKKVSTSDEYTTSEESDEEIYSEKKAPAVGIKVSAKQESNESEEQQSAGSSSSSSSSESGDDEQPAEAPKQPDTKKEEQEEVEEKAAPQKEDAPKGKDEQKKHHHSKKDKKESSKKSKSKKEQKPKQDKEKSKGKEKEKEDEKGKDEKKPSEEGVNTLVVVKKDLPSLNKKEMTQEEAIGLINEASKNTYDAKVKMEKQAAKRNERLAPKKSQGIPDYLEYGISEDCEALKIDKKAVEEDSRKNVHGEADGYAPEGSMETCDCCCFTCDCDCCYVCCCFKHTICCC